MLNYYSYAKLGVLNVSIWLQAYFTWGKCYPSGQIETLKYQLKQDEKLYNFNKLQREKSELEQIKKKSEQDILEVDKLLGEVEPRLQAQDQKYQESKLQVEEAQNAVKDCRNNKTSFEKGIDREEYEKKAQENLHEQQKEFGANFRKRLAVWKEKSILNGKIEENQKCIKEKAEKLTALQQYEEKQQLLQILQDHQWLQDHPTLTSVLIKMLPTTTLTQQLIGK